ncbi:MAG: TolC family protein [candidate division Zixibacteria bacterium]|nr:TolC family protein [candidate division Zixibacteria bacterium]
MKLVVTVLTALVVAVRPAAAGELTLEQAVGLAREQSPQARIAALGVSEAAARAAEARAAFLPMVRVASGYTASDNAVNAFMFALNQGQFALAGDLNNPPRWDNFQLSAQVGLNLFNGGRDLANLRAARGARAGAEFARSAADQEMVLGVTRMYLAVLTAQEAEEAARLAVEAYASAEQVMASRVENGTALRTDLLGIQVEKARAEERLLQARNGLALAKEGLRLAIGLDTLGFDEFQSLDEIAPAAPAAVQAGVRPEVQAQTSFARAAFHEYRAAWAGYLPSISAFAAVDYFRGLTYEHDNQSWTAGVMLNWTVFDGLFTGAAIREKRARLRAADEGARLARLQTSVELTSAAHGVEEAAGRVEVMQRAFDLAAEAVRLTEARFAQGLALTSQVIDAQNNLAQTAVGLAQAKADRILALAQLRRALSVPILGER